MNSIFQIEKKMQNQNRSHL